MITLTPIQDGSRSGALQSALMPRPSHTAAGSAEAHTGEVKSALDVHLSSTDRGASTVQDVMNRNEASLLLSLYAYYVPHGLRCLLEQQTR